MAALIPALIKLLISRRGRGGGGGGGGRPKKSQWEYGEDNAKKATTREGTEFAETDDATDTAVKSITTQTEASADRIRRLKERQVGGRG